MRYGPSGLRARYRVDREERPARKGGRGSWREVEEREQQPCCTGTTVSYTKARVAGGRRWRARVERVIGRGYWTAFLNPTTIPPQPAPLNSPVAVAV